MSPFFWESFVGMGRWSLTFCSDFYYQTGTPTPHPKYQRGLTGFVIVFCAFNQMSTPHSTLDVWRPDVILLVRRAKVKEGTRPAPGPTTLKRSGSDYSATIFAKILGASNAGISAATAVGTDVRCWRWERLGFCATAWGSSRFAKTGSNEFG